MIYKLYCPYYYWVMKIEEDSNINLLTPDCEMGLVAVVE
jgi:hypothetical protein